MKGQFRWLCLHVIVTGTPGYWVVTPPCAYLNSVDMDTLDPEPKTLVCAKCQTPAGVEALVRNSGA